MYSRKTFAISIILIEYALPLMYVAICRWHCSGRVCTEIQPIQNGSISLFNSNQISQSSNSWSLLASTFIQQIESTLTEQLFMFSFQKIRLLSSLTNSLRVGAHGKFYRTNRNRLAPFSKAWKSSCISFQLWHCTPVECGMFGKPLGIFAKATVDKCGCIKCDRVFLATRNRLQTKPGVRKWKKL